MNRFLAIGLMGGGVVLLLFGINSANSINSDVSRFFTGSPTDEAVWMTLGGIVLTMIGVFGSLHRVRN